jgi:FPC/CPF motif-containing protein YcgG
MKSQCTNSTNTEGQDDITSFIADKDFPCVGAKSALNRQRMRFGRFGSLGNKSSAIELVSQLRNFSEEFQEPGVDPVSFVAMFDDVLPDEMTFESALWNELKLLSSIDQNDGTHWDASVSSDVSSDNFSFSTAGRAFFVVGLHPNASRLSRKSPVTCLVFNFHNQFEALKSSGKFEPMQKAIRTRDLKLQGSVNPVLSAYGKSTEARQYSGRSVGDNWKCPVHFRTSSNV